MERQRQRQRQRQTETDRDRDREREREREYRRYEQGRRSEEHLLLLDALHLVEHLVSTRASRY